MVPAVTIDSVLAGARARSKVYIKVDTQGYERHVIAGGQYFLSNSSRWVIKLEFTPRLLQLHGTDPVVFLLEMVTRFRTVELPARARFKRDTLSELLEEPVALEDCAAFSEYIRALAHGDEGYCDLILLPPNQRSAN